MNRPSIPALTAIPAPLVEWTERDCVALLKDIAHCSDVFYTFRPDLHARLIAFERALKDGAAWAAKERAVETFYEIKDSL